MRAVNFALAGSWVLLLAGVGMRWPALAWVGAGAFCAFAGVWILMFARSRCYTAGAI